MTKPLVLFKGLTRDFASGDGSVNRVVDDASGSIGPRARIALVGPSGSGKTTLLNLIGGLDEPSSGMIEWPGLGDKARLRPRHLAYVFQAQSLFPALDVIDNVCLPAMLAGDMKGARERAQSLIERLELGDVGDKFPDELSGGQSQRVAVARALLLSPALLLADEPTGQLDSTTAAHVLEVMLEDVAQAEGALVVATHDPAIAARLSTRWAIEHGNLHTCEGHEGT